MPVAQILCEGGGSSPDARVLSRILPGYEIRPSGSKYGMGDKIVARREIRGADTVFGLLDGDRAGLQIGQRLGSIGWFGRRGGVC